MSDQDPLFMEAGVESESSALIYMHENKQPPPHITF